MVNPRPAYQDHSEIAREVPRWLWPGRIPLGKITILMGDPGTGKSFIALNFACIVSRGGKWPTGESAEETKTIILTDEDDVNDTIGPRIDVMQGKPENITQFLGVHRREGHISPFTFSRDLASLEELIVLKRASLVVIDPISAYLGYVDSFKEADVRETLTPLAKLAASQDCAIVGVAHMNKNQESKAVYRVGGSIAFTALARAVHLVAKDPDDPERRLMLPVKFNLGLEPKGLAYRIVDVQHPLGFTVGLPEWEGLTEEAVEDVIGEMEEEDTRETLAQAEGWLEELFEGNTALPQRFVEQSAKESRIPTRALLRAKRTMGVESVRQGRFWWWRREVEKGEERKPP